jgi:hypothetical protein
MVRFAKVPIKTAAFILILAITMWPGSSRAQALFTFDVPVELNNLHPDFRQGRVTCFASQFPAREIASGRLAGGERITNGGNSTAFSIDAGRYSGTSTVTMDGAFVLPGRRAQDANGYNCYIMLNNGRDWLEPVDILRWGPAAAGTTPQLFISGVFPPR